MILLTGISIVMHDSIEILQFQVGIPFDTLLSSAIVGLPHLGTGCGNHSSMVAVLLNLLSEGKSISDNFVCGSSSTKSIHGIYEKWEIPVSDTHPILSEMKVPTE
jgi:hypothetical protein